MANDYFNYNTTLTPGQLARATQVGDLFEAVEAAFTMLPTPEAVDGEGWSSAVKVGVATLDSHAARWSQVKTWTTNVSAGGYKLTNLLDGTSSQDACTVAQATALGLGGGVPSSIPITSLGVGTLADQEVVLRNGSAVDGIAIPERGLLSASSTAVVAKSAASVRYLYG